jgi:hypothetical protein
MTGRAKRLRGIVAGVFVAACAIALSLGLAAPASAAPGGVEIDIVSQGAGFTASPVGPLLDMDRLAPGAATSAVLGVRSTESGAADFAIQFVNVTSDENGCTHTELAEPGGCGPGAGQLRGALTASLAVADAALGPYQQIWTGSAADLEAGVQFASGVRSGVARWVRVSLGLPTSVGNEVQSDQYHFSVRIAAQYADLAGGGTTGSGTTAGAAVAGVSVGPADHRVAASVDITGAGRSGHGVLGSGLAFTGVPTAMLAGAGLLLCLCGALLVMGAWESRRARHNG